MNNIDISKTVSVTGHRALKKDFNKREIEKIFTELILAGYNNFLIGMAIGFDSECFKTLEKLKNNFQIKIIACVPCLVQDKLWSSALKAEYKRQIKVADDVIIIDENYSVDAMYKRNRFLVDNSNVLVCYIYKQSGGSYYTVKYAALNNKKIIYIK